MSRRLDVFTKDPNATLDWVVSWALWLEDADSIVASIWVTSAAMTVEGDSFSDVDTTVWLSGGVEGERETITNRVTTADGRVEDFSFMLIIRQK